MKKKKSLLLAEHKNILMHEVTIDWPSFFSIVAKTGFSFYLKNPKVIISAISDFKSLVKIKKELPNEAITVLLSSYFLCLADAIGDAHLNYAIHQFQNKIKIDAFKFDLEELGNLYLEDTTFFKTITLKVKETLTKEKFSPKDIEKIIRHTREEHARYLRAFLIANHSSFPQFKEFYKTVLLPNQEIWTKPELLEDYREKLNEQFASPTLLDGINLDQIYVEPTCTALISTSKSRKKDIQEPQSISKLVMSLLDLNRPIVIVGEPGHGKTSFVKYLGSFLANNPECGWFPIFSEFKNIQPENDFQGLDPQAQDFLNDEFPSKKRTLFILDGLDEILGSSTPPDLFTKFLDRLMEKMKKYQRLGIGGNIIITSRKKFLEAQPDCIPSTIPHHLLRIDNFDQEKIEKWMGKFNAHSGEEKVTLKTLEGYGFFKSADEDFIGQPVLLSMVAGILANPVGRELFQKGNNSHTKYGIYRTIVQWTYNREKNKETGVAARVKFKDFEDFQLFLESIAYVLIKNETQALDVRSFKEDWKGEKDLERSFPLEVLEEKLVNIKLVFYFKGKGEILDSMGMEFYHKTFHDFFVANLILRALSNINFLIKRYPKDEITAHMLLKVLGWQKLDSSIFEFLKEGVEESKDLPSGDLGPLLEHLKIVFREQTLHHYYDCPEVLNLLGKRLHEFSVHGLANFHKIILLLNEVFTLAGGSALNLWPKTDPELLQKFIGFLNSLTPNYFNDCDFLFKNIVLEKQNIVGIDFIRSRFSNTRFEECTFIKCDFISAYFMDSNLINCNFKRHDQLIMGESIISYRNSFTATTFKNCTIENSRGFYFWKNTIQDSIVKKVEIHSASECDFKGTEFVDCNFHSSDIHDCKYSNVIFQDCSLKPTDKPDLLDTDKKKLKPLEGSAVRSAIRDFGFGINSRKYGQYLFILDIANFLGYLDSNQKNKVLGLIGMNSLVENNDFEKMWVSVVKDIERHKKKNTKKTIT